MTTTQEEFWKGEFGDDYSKRNRGDHLSSSNIAFFSKILSKATSPIRSVIEFGCNIGMNLRAIRCLLPESDLVGIEINDNAVNELRQWNGAEIIHDSILQVNITQKYDLVLTKGVLIHINPLHLTDLYNKLYTSSNKYICIAEYYNPTPVEISYRGHRDKLFKRDFAGEMMANHRDLELVDYGFVYHHDPLFPQDDITWFLLKK